MGEYRGCTISVSEPSNRLGVYTVLAQAVGHFQIGHIDAGDVAQPKLYKLYFGAFDCGSASRYRSSTRPIMHMHVPTQHSSMSCT